MKNLKNPSFHLTLSMIIFGTLAPFVRYIGLTSGELALYRAILAAVIILVYFLLTKNKLSFKNLSKDLILLLISGAAMGINWILLFEAYNYTTVSIATLSYYFAPVIVMVLCPIIFKEKLTPLKIVSFIFSTVGLVLIVGITGGLKGSGTGILFGLGAATFYATVIILNKFIKNVSGLDRTFLQFLSAIIVLIPYVTLSNPVGLFSLDKRGWICLLVVGIIHTGITYCLYFGSIKNLSGHKVAIISYLDPLVAVLVSVFFLKEAITIPQIIGGALILIFSIFGDITPNKKEKTLS